MGPCPLPGGGSRKPPTLIHPRPFPASAGILSIAGASAATGMLVAQSATPVPNAAATAPSNIFSNPMRLKWPIEANFSIGASSLYLNGNP